MLCALAGCQYCRHSRGYFVKIFPIDVRCTISRRWPGIRHHSYHSCCGNKFRPKAALRCFWAAAWVIVGTPVCLSSSRLPIYAGRIALRPYHHASNSRPSTRSAVPRHRNPHAGRGSSAFVARRKRCCAPPRLTICTIGARTNYDKELARSRASASGLRGAGRSCRWTGHCAFGRQCSERAQRPGYRRFFTERAATLQLIAFPFVLHENPHRVLGGDPRLHRAYSLKSMFAQIRWISEFGRQELGDLSC